MALCTYYVHTYVRTLHTYVRTCTHTTVRTQASLQSDHLSFLSDDITPGPSPSHPLSPQTKVSSESHYAGVVARAQAAAALAKTKQGGGKRAASTLKASPADMLQDSEANLTAVESKEMAEGQEYRDSRTYVLLEVSLQKPLIPRRTAAVLAERCVHANVL